ncbi:MAG: hydantoinase/oxoprolinase family protein, partial [Alphaproteobacteria bacterium]|nr:hydantoinase/oxoprolinase family protein [Alphaproteobacteria bacterium]
GGAGPLHASLVAREIGMKKIIVPQSPGHFSAFGMLFSDLRYDYVQTAPSRLADVEFEDIEAIYEQMELTGFEAVERTSIDVGEIVSLRSTVTGLMQKPPLEEHLARGEEIHDEAKTGSRPVYFGRAKGFIETPSYARENLLAGNRISGPAVVEEHASTTVLFPGDEMEVDGFGNLMITVGRHSQ